jgi:hypothetical protein
MNDLNDLRHLNLHTTLGGKTADHSRGETSEIRRDLTNHVDTRLKRLVTQTTSPIRNLGMKLVAHDRGDIGFIFRELGDELLDSDTAR